MAMSWIWTLMVGAAVLSGYSRRRAGRSSRDSPRASPDRSITSITPIHRHSTPIMDRHSSTR